MKPKPLPKNVPLFRDEAVAHRTDSLLGDVYLTPSRLLTAFSIAAMVLASVLITSLFLVEFRRATSATGWLEYSPKPVDVVSVRGGTVAKVLVREGERVQEGQKVLTVSTARSSTLTPAVEQELLAHLEEERRALNDQIGSEQVLAATRRRALLAARQRAREAIERSKKLIELQDRKLELATQNRRRIERLVQDSLLPVNDLSVAEQQELGAKLARAELIQKMASEDEALSSTNASLEELPNTLNNRLATIRASISALEQRIAEASSMADAVIISGVSGRAANLRVSPGQTVSAGERLMVVIPDDAELQAQIMVPTSASGFLAVGMPVRIAIDSFPAHKFGHVKGEVLRIDDVADGPPGAALAARSDSSFYRVSVSLAADHVMAYGEALSLRSGMTVKAQLIQDHRTAVEWILDPILATTGRI